MGMCGLVRMIVNECRMYRDVAGCVNDCLIWFDLHGLIWIGGDWIGLVWIGLAWFGLVWVCLGWL
jgi:hypothetical protein